MRSTRGLKKKVFYAVLNVTDLKNELEKILSETEASHRDAVTVCLYFRETVKYKGQLERC